ncbi:1-(5-phosphoribosyl)-5-[(5-phosphoribosylamino)methylideneamino] imidazole-4-carboxamide isomerase [Ornithinimicrobium sp. INDO-MA30-4]|nr:1-(5-phosphoribosyl)-5-[(5-phosphoribosylamino)methylideneamino] imidazole-4-carboxamide isomerase [Ornithinimicrobium sp. INDO-MA30-4]UJH71147.1 1-(5-phosphoribosyl)-5-[(5-phosphoribosylamino)methylideneamino] imidazole-4-carboxamide isomerase [Ornithinimicrobium sp. INDO-MA30-4]
MTDHHTQEFTVYPAIDVLDGNVVRLHKGDYDKETRYADKPIAVAQSYARAGARWLHLVDLDAARAGGYRWPCAGRSSHLDRSADPDRWRCAIRGRRAAVARLGATRVVVGSMAVTQPDEVMSWIERFGPESITVALDTKVSEEGTWLLPVSGWTSVSDTDLPTMLAGYAKSGLKHVLCTDIGRDGTLSGPNTNLYTYLTHSNPSLHFQASGGARDAADVRGARKVGCAGIVLGKALLEGRVTVPKPSKRSAHERGTAHHPVLGRSRWTRGQGHQVSRSHRHGRHR